MAVERGAVVAGLAVCLLAAVGCGHAPPSPAPRTVTSIRQRGGMVGPTHFDFWQRTERTGDRVDEQKILVWLDRYHNMSGGGGGGETFQRATFPDGNAVEWRFSTASGTPPDLRIDGTRYDLADGRVFLVSTRGATAVRQIDTPIPAVQSDTANLKALAVTQPDIKAFVEVATRAAAD